MPESRRFRRALTNAGGACPQSTRSSRRLRRRTRSPDVDLEESDTAEGIDLPGADLSGEVLTMPVVPQQADEFTCTSCFLVHHRSRIAAHTGGRLVCIDCT